jgi:hypothetical protein
MARDIYHQHVKEALIKDGWTITQDPFMLKSGNVRMEIDLAAEQTFAASKDSIEIVVEVKSFLGKSKLHDFYEAKGQYSTYEHGLRHNQINRKLYLAIEEDIFNSFFQKPFIQSIIQEDHIDLIVFNQESKTIVQWVVN